MCGNWPSTAPPMKCTQPQARPWGIFTHAPSTSSQPPPFPGLRISMSIASSFDRSSMASPRPPKPPRLPSGKASRNPATHAHPSVTFLCHTPLCHQPPVTTPQSPPCLRGRCRSEHWGWMDVCRHARVVVGNVPSDDARTTRCRLAGRRTNNAVVTPLLLPTLTLPHPTLPRLTCACVWHPAAPSVHKRERCAIVAAWRVCRTQSTGVSSRPSSHCACAACRGASAHPLLVVWGRRRSPVQAMAFNALLGRSETPMSCASPEASRFAYSDEFLHPPGAQGPHMR